MKNLIKKIMEYSKELLESAKAFFKQMVEAVEKEQSKEEPDTPVAPDPPVVVAPEIPEEEEPTPPVVVEPVDPVIIQPTEETPIVYNLSFGTTVNLKWLPVEGALKYLVQILPDGGSSFVTRGRDVIGTEYSDQRTKAGDKSHYRIYGYTATEKIEVGTIWTEVPEEDEEVTGASEFPDEIPENTEYFRITVDLESDQDQTVHIQKQIDAVPNGTKEKYHALEFYSPDGNIWTEGDLDNNPFGWKGAIHLIGRRYLIIKGIGEDKVRFYTKEPAVPYGNSIHLNTHSRRTLFKLRNFVNIWFYNVIGEGGNTYLGDTIGTTPELTPKWWTKGSPDTGSNRTSYVWQPEWESEHGVDARNGKMLKFSNCEFRYLFGDGIYADDVQGVIIDKDTIAESVGRQNYGFSNGVTDLRMTNFKALNPRRAAIDWEPMNDGKMSDLTVTKGFIEGRVAIGGSGDVNNTKLIGNYQLRALTALGDGDRRDMVIDDNQKVGGFGSPIALIRVYGYINVSVQRNHWLVPTNQGRVAFEINGCSGKIIVGGNTYSNPSIVRILDCKEGAKIIFNEDAPDNVYVIEVDGVKEITGTNSELLALIEKKGY